MINSAVKGGRRFLSWWTLENAKNFFTLLASATAIVGVLAAVFLLSRANVELDQPVMSIYIDPGVLEEQALSFDAKEMALAAAETYNEMGESILFFGTWTSRSDNPYVPLCEQYPAVVRQVYGASDCVEVPMYAEWVLDQIPAENHLEALIAFEASRRARFDLNVSNTGSATARDVSVLGPPEYEPIEPMPFDLPPGQSRFVTFLGFRISPSVPSNEAMSQYWPGGPLRTLADDSFHATLDAESSRVINYSALLWAGALIFATVLAVLLGQIRRDWPSLWRL